MDYGDCTGTGHNRFRQLAGEKSIKQMDCILNRENLITNKHKLELKKLKATLAKTDTETRNQATFSVPQSLLGGGKCRNDSQSMHKVNL